MKYLIIISTFCILLTACTTVQVEKGYNEVTKKKFCRLSNYQVASGWKKYASLYFENQDNNLKSLVQVNDISTLSAKSDFRNHPEVTFGIYKDGQKIDEVKLKTQTLDAKDWHEPIFYNGIIIGYAHNSKTSSSLPLSKEDFRKIAYANSVSFILSDANDSMDGELSSSKLDLLREFDKQCLSAK